MNLIKFISKIVRIMKKYLIFCASIISLFSIISCTNHSEIDLIESIPEIDLITYDEHVKTIIDNNCIFCHGNPPTNGAPNALTTYDNVKSAVDNANLISRISALSGEPGAMPFGGPRLPQNLIDLIIQWEADGLLEN
jgi:hypothetical protein